FFYLESKNKFDIVIDEIHGIPFFTPLYVHNSKKVAFIHEVAGEIWDYMYPFPINYIGKLLEVFYFRLYQRVTFWTDAPSTIDELVSKGIPWGNCTAIPCPITNSVVSKIPEKEEDPTFIFVSRLVKMKGIERVLEAFKYIVEKEPKAKLWIVGPGDPSYVSVLHDRVRLLGPSVKFWGRVSQVKKLELMGKAHVLLHASVKEGWGLVVLEAGSQGTPAVVYNVAGLRDVVKDGKTGVVLVRNTPEDLAQEALKLLYDKKQYALYQKNGLEWVKGLTWEKTTLESESLLKSL
ncbi:MAG: glycosyltransferase family 4 protein, partial [Patescibacteria group bacterium]|nr:glycosyltransferase family 4 protein [Patescibacteria group bacterium]